MKSWNLKTAAESGVEGRTSRRPWPCKPGQLGLRIGLQAHKEAKAHSHMKWYPFHVVAENRGKGAAERWHESSLCIRNLKKEVPSSSALSLLSQPSDLPKRWKCGIYSRLLFHNCSRETPWLWSLSTQCKEPGQGLP